MKNLFGKKFSRKFIKEYERGEKMNNLERFYAIQKQPTEVLC